MMIDFDKVCVLFQKIARDLGFSELARLRSARQSTGSFCAAARSFPIVRVDPP
jgi:hypothetical protein